MFETFQACLFTQLQERMEALEKIRREELGLESGEEELEPELTEEGNHLTATIQQAENPEKQTTWIGRLD